MVLKILVLKSLVLKLFLKIMLKILVLKNWKKSVFQNLVKIQF